MFCVNMSRLYLGYKSTIPRAMFHHSTFPRVVLPIVSSEVSVLPSFIPFVPLQYKHLHTSAVLERARQSTRIRKRKVALANKKKKEERIRKNPPPIPKKVQLMLIAKGLGKEPAPWRHPDSRPFPEDDVWSEMWCTWPRMSVKDSLESLSEHYHPTMLNRPEEMVWAKLEFNLQAPKKEKFMDGYSKMVPVYNPFERGVAEKTIMVFAKDPEAVQAAEAAGALKAGGLELVDDLAKGKIDVSDIDHFLAHEDIIKDLKPLIGILRDKMPSKPQGSVSSDLPKLVKTFAHGMSVSVIKPGPTLGYAEDPSYAYAELQIGRLNMDPELVESNLTTALTTLREQAPKRSGSYITRCQLYVEGPLKTKFDIHHPLIDDEKYVIHLATIPEEASSG